MGFKRLTRNGALALLLMALTGCASIPLGTMWRLHSFDISDLRNLDPADIRVVVKLPEDVGFDAEKSTFDVMITPKTKGTAPVKKHATLKLLAKGRYVPAHVPVAEKGDIWYLTELSPDGQRAFRDLQLKLAGHDVEKRYDTARINVSVTFGSSADATAKIMKGLKLTVWLHLNRDDDYFPLLEDLALQPSSAGTT